MWRASLRKSTGRLKTIKEFSVFNKEFSRAFGLRGFLVEERPNLDCRSGFVKNMVHLPWCREGFGGRRVDPTWPPRGARGIANSAAEVLVSSDEAEEASTSEEDHFSRNKSHKGPMPAETKEFLALRKKQAKIETDAWKQTVQEYRELMQEMCSKKLAPSLPYMKSLFLGWFEPLRDAIAKEQHALQETVKFRVTEGELFRDCMCQLPPEMMSVITMHKLVGILMTAEDGSGPAGGGARLIYTALQIGEAVENEVRIHKFLEKTKKKPKRSKKVEGENQEIVTKEHEVLRKQVTNMMKMRKMRQVTWILKKEEDSKPWDPTLHAKVGSRLLELLLETAFIQPPNDQSTEGPPDVRPAFKHALRRVTTGKVVRMVGVIECDPLVRRGLERTARHMVMPYMPMLVTPCRWRGHEKGGYIFLPSSVMRIHGAKQQRDAIKSVPMKQIEKVYKALDVLGLTKWRVNKRVLDVVDTIWAEGGRLADLVDRGVDKLSYDGRLAFVEENIDNIIDSAERPLEGKRWWLGAEDPFQCLSACMYMSDALKSSCPESVICHMPVHQDGSCNGLQHYAALGRDKLGAEAVNLIGGDKPADVYSSIADRVDEIMQKDALQDPAKNRNAANARLLLGQVDRKLVKQTVMTSVYGVTYVGARDQIKNRLKERAFAADESELYNASCYAAKVTLTALGEMFNGARSIMTWLADCAKVIAAENETVRWITPLGLPVVQPYRKPARQLVRTHLQVLVLQKESDK
ncbi:hypothetical protein KI387_038915, partial [Taxus chinensis]